MQKAIADMEDILSKQKERDVTEPEKKQEPPQPMSPENKKKTVQKYEDGKPEPTTDEAGGGTVTVEMQCHLLNF